MCFLVRFDDGSTNNAAFPRLTLSGDRRTNAHVCIGWISSVTKQQPKLFTKSTFMLIATFCVLHKIDLVPNELLKIINKGLAILTDYVPSRSSFCTAVDIVAARFQ